MGHGLTMLGAVLNPTACAGKLTHASCSIGPFPKKKCESILRCRAFFLCISLNPLRGRPYSAAVQCRDNRSQEALASQRRPVPHQK